MKQKLLFSLMALLTTMTAWAQGVEINTTNFPDDNFRSYLLSQDYGQDGVLTDAEIAGVKKIYPYYKDIQSLKGIELFTALETLHCYGNQLTSLDVSKNTALKKLSCDYNQLTSLDVSQNTALTELKCSGNQLTSLDVSKNTVLSWLDCGDNQLTSLDVSQNTALSWLDCGDNQLTSLDVSQNTALTTLKCDNNQLTSLDVSKNTALEVLHCYVNQLLTSLVVSKNTALTELKCYQNKINGSAMDALVESLPTVENGSMHAIITFMDDEGNMMTTTQVAAANAKGWKVYCNDSQGWEEYAGIKFVVGDKFTWDNLKYKVTGESPNTVELVGYETEPSGDVVIPATVIDYSVTSIGQKAFYNSTGLTSVTIPEGMTTIGKQAFYGCI